MASAIRSRNMDHLCISYLSTYGLVFGINVRLSSSSFQWYLRLLVHDTQQKDYTTCSKIHHD